MRHEIPIKTPQEIALMRKVCSITSQLLDEVAEVVQPGNTTEDIDRFIHQRTIELGAFPAPLNYKGFPKSVCTSRNEVICHGIPSQYERLQEGDILNVDVTSIKDGYFGDSSRMFFVGGEQACSEEAVTLVNDTHKSLMAGIEVVRPGGKIGDIGAAIVEFIKSTGREYGIVREYTGHGIGREFHEAPQVVHVSRKGTGDLIAPGMTFTVEPMINAGTHKTVLSNQDGWTVRTADGALSAQWEHTVLVTESGVEILT